jgi:hypothetical protein
MMAVSSNTKKQTKVTAPATKKSFTPVKYFCSSALDAFVISGIPSMDRREEELDSNSLDDFC